MRKSRSSPVTRFRNPARRVGATTREDRQLQRSPIADAEKPLEVLRTIHSFDPCMACACHTFDPEGKRIAEVKVL